MVKAANYGVRLDGNTYLRIQNQKFEQFEIDFTYIPFGGAALNTLVTLNPQGGAGFFWAYIDGTTNRLFVQRNRNGGSPNYFAKAAPFVFVPNGRYKIHLELSVDHTKVYVNEVLNDTIIDPEYKFLMPTENLLHIGSYVGGTTHKTKGIFHSFKWWNSGVIKSFKFNQLPSDVEAIGSPVYINTLSAKKVLGKNFLPPLDVTRYNETTGTGVNNTIENGKLAVRSYSSAHHGKGIIIDTVPGKQYVLSGFAESNAEGKLGACYIGTSATLGDLASGTVNGYFAKAFTATTSKAHIKFNSASTTALASPVLYSQLQLEEGSVATPHEPYREVNKARKQLLVARGTPQVYTSTDNFVGKVTGSTVENPHTAKHVINQSVLQPPTGIWAELGTPHYGSISSLNGISMVSTATSNGVQAQQLFSFNLIKMLQHKLNFIVPGVNVAAQVQWLKDNLSKITANWHGFGSSPTGNKANVSWWNNTFSLWSSAQTTLSGSVVKVVRDTAVTSVIDTNGFVHFLAYTDPSNGTIASAINTDFIELVVETKSISIGEGTVKLAK
jgi:hypothetical protein